MRHVLFVLTASVVALAWPRAATADGVILRLDVGHQIAADGNPALASGYAVSRVIGPQAVTWQTCSPECGASGPALTEIFKPGPTAVGTRFQGSVTVDGITTTTLGAKSWLGQVADVTPPVVSGEPRIGADVRVVKGTWTGGWGDDRSYAGIRACPTPAGVGCVAVQASAAQPDAEEPFRVTVPYAGWYLGAVETRYGADTLFALSGLVFPTTVRSARPAPTPSQIVAAGPLVGPIPRATRAQRQVLQPTLILHHTARTESGPAGRLELGTLRCPQGCDATYRVRRAASEHARGRTVTRRARMQPDRSVVIRIGAKTFRPGTELTVTASFVDRHDLEGTTQVPSGH